MTGGASQNALRLFYKSLSYSSKTYIGFTANLKVGFDQELKALRFERYFNNVEIEK